MGHGKGSPKGLPSPNVGSSTSRNTCFKSNISPRADNVRCRLHFQSFPPFSRTEEIKRFPRVISHVHLNLHPFPSKRSRDSAPFFLPAISRVSGRLPGPVIVVGDVHAQSGGRRSPAGLFPRGLRAEDADLGLHARRVQVRRLRRRLAAAAVHPSERSRVGGGSGGGGR